MISTHSTLATSLTKLLALLLLLALPIACGDEGGEDSDGGNKTPLADEARQKLSEAGDNVQDLHGTLTWIRGKLKGNEGAEGGALASIESAVGDRLGSSLRTLVGKIGNGENVEAMKKIDAWMVETLAAEEAAESSVAADFKSELQRLREYRLVHEPNNDELRTFLGWSRVAVDLDELGEAPYLDTNDVNKVKEAKKWLTKYGSKSGHTIWLRPGWKEEKKFEAFLAAMDKKKAAYDELMKDPFEQEAQKVAAEIGDFLRKDLENDTYQFVARTHRPYVIIVEKDQSWNETDVARRRGEALTQLHQIYYEKYGKNVELRKIEKPVPVIYFRNRDAYVRYTQKRGMSGALGHFEGDTGRLFTSKGTDIGTVFHEGTHQLSFFSSGAASNFLQRSYWFEEGLAEYLAGNSIKKDKETGKWVYEIGLLQKGRLNYWRQNLARAYSLWDLLELTYAHREINTRNGDQDKNLMVYSQGWFLCYFMNNFKLDSDGLVKIGEKGKYQDAWIKFFEANLGGSSTRATFLKCVGIKDQDDPKWKTFEKEFTLYFEWMNRKLALKHDKDNKLVAWQDVIYRGRNIGDREDDLLELPEPK